MKKIFFSHNHFIFSSFHNKKGGKVTGNLFENKLKTLPQNFHLNTKYIFRPRGQRSTYISVQNQTPPPPRNTPKFTLHAPFLALILPLKHLFYLLISTTVLFVFPPLLIFSPFFLSYFSPQIKPDNIPTWGGGGYIIIIIILSPLLRLDRKLGV
jgi:hypothetical protein